MKLNSLMQTNFLLSFPRSSRRNFFTYSSFFLFRLLIINHSKRWIRKKSLIRIWFFHLLPIWIKNHSTLSTPVASNRKIFTASGIPSERIARSHQGNLQVSGYAAVATPTGIADDPGCAPWKGEQPRVCTDLMMPRWCSLKFHFDVPRSRARLRRESKGCPRS